MFPRGGCHRGAGSRGLDRSCFSAWVDPTHGWFPCGLLLVVCVQGVQRGVCQPHKAAQPQLPEGAWACCATSPGFEEASGQPMVLLKREPRHPQMLKPLPSSREHLQVPRALPLRRHLLWARASPEFPLWRCYQKMMGLHRRLASLCAVSVSDSVATRVSTAATDNDQPCKCGVGLNTKM